MALCYSRLKSSIGLFSIGYLIHPMKSVDGGHVHNLHSREASRCCNTTHVVIVSGHHDVSSHTPAFTPTGKKNKG